MSARVLVLALLLAGCDWSLHRMADQPRCDPFEQTTLLRGGTCQQAPPTGTVPWGAPPATGRPQFDRALLIRGRDRFDRLCAACHGALADGRSQVAENMTLRRPPSLHEPRLIAAPDERLFDVVTHGFGLMPAYGPEMAPADRWAVVGWIRILQRSQQVPVDRLSPALRKEADRWLQ